MVALFVLAANSSGQQLETARDVNLRKGPSSSSQVITIIDSGTFVDSLMRRSGWDRVQTRDGTKGWIYAHYLKPRVGKSTPFVVPFSRALSVAGRARPAGEHCLETSVEDRNFPHHVAAKMLLATAVDDVVLLVAGRQVIHLRDLLPIDRQPALNGALITVAWVDDRRTMEAAELTCDLRVAKADAYGAVADGVEYRANRPTVEDAENIDASDRSLWRGSEEIPVDDFMARLRGLCGARSGHPSAWGRH